MNELEPFTSESDLTEISWNITKDILHREQKKY